MDEKELLEIAERFKNNTKYIDDDLGYCLGSDVGNLIAEVRKLKEEYKSLKESHFVYFAENITLREERDYLNQAIEALKEENQHYKQALEEIVDLGYSTIDQEIAKNALEEKPNEPK